MRTFPWLVFLVACSKAAPTSESTPTSGTTPPTETDTTDTPTDTTDTTTTDSAPSTTPTGDTGTVTVAKCDAVNSGPDWAWRGSCPGMVTPCSVLVTGCDLAVSYPGGMTMGMPTAGVVAGSDVTFDDNGVPGCVGTVMDADSIQGTCRGGGCDFTLTR